MPINRSPPAIVKTSSSPALLSQAPSEIIITQDSDTASEKVLSDFDQEISNISRRTKRKHGDVAFAELKELMCDIQRKQEADFHSLKQDMQVIKQQNTEYQKSLEFLSGMYDNLLLKFDSVAKENMSYKSRIHVLENKVDHLERSLKSSSIEIRNIPARKPETKHDLKAHVLRLGEVVNQPVHENEIRDIFRIRAKTEPGPIIVEFTTTLRKENILKSVINFNKDQGKEQKINTSHFKIQGNPAPIYVADNLTSKTRRLYYMSREFTKNHHHASCWTAFGKVYLRLREGQPPVRIDCEEDITKLSVEK